MGIFSPLWPIFSLNRIILLKIVLLTDSLYHFLSLLPSSSHTFNLSFLLHGQDFRKPNFTPKKTTKDTKNTKNFSEKVKCMQFFHPIWKNLHLTEIFYTGTACDACDKLKVCIHPTKKIFWQNINVGIFWQNINGAIAPVFAASAAANFCCDNNCFCGFGAHAGVGRAMATMI